MYNFKFYDGYWKLFQELVQSTLYGKCYIECKVIVIISLNILR